MFFVVFVFVILQCRHGSAYDVGDTVCFVNDTGDLDMFTVTRINMLTTVSRPTVFSICFFDYLLFPFSLMSLFLFPIKPIYITYMQLINDSKKSSVFGKLPITWPILDDKTAQVLYKFRNAISQI